MFEGKYSGVGRMMSPPGSRFASTSRNRAKRTMLHDEKHVTLDDGTDRKMRKKDRTARVVGPQSPPPAISSPRQPAGGGIAFAGRRRHFSFVPVPLELGGKALLGAAGVAAAFLGFLYFNQENMLYIPQLDPDAPRANAANPPGYRSPKEYDIPFEEEWIESGDGVQIHTWLLLKEDPSRPTIVFFHGNAGNVGIRLPNAERMYNLLDCNVFLVEYRGYGDSKASNDTRGRFAKPSEAGLKRDGEAAVRYLQNHPRINPSKIILFGRSLGGAVAFHVAQKLNKGDDTKCKTMIPPSSSSSPPPPLAGMIVENTFCSIDDMVDVLFPFLSRIKGPMLKMHWNSKAIASTLTDLPILYLSGQKDEVVPPDQMRSLYEASTKSSSSCSSSNLVAFHNVPNGLHNDTWLKGGEAYWRAMLQFITQTTSNVPR